MRSNLKIDGWCVSATTCSPQAVACLQALAKGLRKDFKTDAKSFVALLLDKFKDKNSAVCRNTAAALLAMHRHGSPL